MADPRAGALGPSLWALMLLLIPAKESITPAPCARAQSRGGRDCQLSLQESVPAQGVVLACSRDLHPTSMSLYFISSCTGIHPAVFRGQTQADANQYPALLVRLSQDRNLNGNRRVRGSSWGPFIAERLTWTRDSRTVWLLPEHGRQAGHDGWTPLGSTEQSRDAQIRAFLGATKAA